MDTRFAAYLPGIRQRRLKEQKSWQERRERAWASARRAAAVLHQYGASQVIAFGSLVRQGPFDERSDIDLAVEGIAAAQFFRAAAAAAAECELELDVIDWADASPAVREEIRRDGVPL